MAQRDLTEADELNLAIGGIVTNLQSLEFVLRLFMAKANGTKLPDLAHLQAGQVVAVNEVTNHDSLRPVIQKAYAKLKELGAPERVDESLVELRDAICHGKLFSLSAGKGPYRLVKFGKENKDNTVEVVWAKEYDPERLGREVDRSGKEIHKVVKVAKRLGYWPS